MSDRPNALTRFFHVGVADAGTRLDAFLAPRPDDRTGHILASSELVRFVDRQWAYIARLWEASTAAQATERFLGEWNGATWQLRRRMTGILLLMAVFVHVSLTMIQGPEQGWFWLVLPGMAAGVGVLLVPVQDRPSGPARS